MQRHAEALRVLRERFGDVPIDDLSRPRSTAARPTVYITLGASALQASLDARLDAPVISLLASRQSYERSATSAPGTFERSAIYAEPNPEHQMRIVAALFRRAVSVGTLLSDATAHLQSSLGATAAAYGLHLQAVRVPPSVGVSRALNALDAASVLLIQPDTDLYTQETLRELLESTYRRRLPVIGFSAALVAAGTLASAYSDLDDVALQLQGLLDTLATGRMPPPAYPAYWRVAVNNSVARSLDVQVDDVVRRMGDRP